MIQFFEADDEKPRLDAVNSDAVRAYLADVLKRKSASTANPTRTSATAAARTSASVRRTRAWSFAACYSS
jgi:hypothetical protein